LIFFELGALLKKELVSTVLLSRERGGWISLKGVVFTNRAAGGSIVSGELAPRHWTRMERMERNAERKANGAKRYAAASGDGVVLEYNRNTFLATTSIVSSAVHASSECIVRMKPRALLLGSRDGRNVLVVFFFLSFLAGARSS
jgi:hypothetical protein